VFFTQNLSKKLIKTEDNVPAVKLKEKKYKKI
jgi:hypothetical protein